jgi:protein TonB
MVKPISSKLLNVPLQTPSRIPEQAQTIKEEEAPPLLASAGGVEGGVLEGVSGGIPGGGIPGGVGGGVLGGILRSAPVAVPKVAAPQRVKVAQGLSEGMLVHRVSPSYPVLARRAHISGTVVLLAVISKSGTIDNLSVKEGDPTLASAAMEAVRQWKYKPYCLNGEPVEVETVITVNFALVRG